MIRAGIVGLGFMGRRYTETLGQMQGVEVAAIGDTRPDVLAEIASTSGARGFADAAELVRSDEVDAVFLCTPEDAHAEIAVAALEAGKHLLIEKPVTHDLASAAAVRTAAARSTGIAMVGHILRFEARWATAHKLIAQGRIGAVTSTHTRRVGNVRDQDVLKGRTSIPLYYGVHDLDIVRWFAGAQATSIQAARRSGVLRDAGYDIDDLYCAILAFDNGVLATAELGWHVPASAVNAPSSGITVVGTEGWLRIEQGQTGLAVHTNDEAGASGLAVDVSFWPDVHARTNGALRSELEHFLDCVRSGEEPLVTVDDGREALRLSLAMEDAAQDGGRIDLGTYGT